MKSGASRPSTQAVRASAIAAICLIVASCTGAGLADLEVGNPKYESPESATTAAASEQPAATDAQDGSIVSLAAEQDADIGNAFTPAAKPDQAAIIPMSVPAQDAAPGQAAAAPADGAPTKAAQLTSDAAPAPAPSQPVNAFAEPAAKPDKKGFLANLFSSTPQEAPVMSTPAPKPKPIVQIAALNPAEKASPRAALDAEDDASASARSGDALPGVRQSSLFEITRKDSLEDDSDVDVNEDEYVRVASAAGLARLAPNGLLKQRESVDVSCLKPSLVRMLKQMEGHFGKRLVVTSGYRSPEYNRKVRGARRSMHMYCAAVDIHMEGVSKHELARYARAMPGRGGVGTYCHTDAIHVDVGPERDWNWRCRARKRG